MSSTGPIVVPTGGVSSYKRVPSKVHRRTLSRPVYKRRTCRDNRAYSTIPFTIRGPLVVADYDPMERVDRDYWIARLVMNVGLHNDGTHPDDGTPSGGDIVANMRRVSRDLTQDDKILNSDARLRIGSGNHQDAINDEEDGPFDTTDFNIHRLAEGEHIYPSILQVGSGRPGTTLVISIVLVPIP